jgi:hypothetical protein
MRGRYVQNSAHQARKKVLRDKVSGSFDAYLKAMRLINPKVVPICEKTSFGHP